ncbi:FprA family A-type flavoprotein [Acetobacterium bakii]|uniref:Flavodoxin n=1 Tax=Acetobacterium bakii TaxID=52689 RepID=A0A0L6U4B0_9FIRM|nr:FprA family A-type flavoprotein [Acetobacterium bakii]KNZ43192.1 flavodoxin [Acetobacterium bakii]
MNAVKIKDDVFWVGVNDYQTTLFEGLWPIDQEGISYNAYLINDEKVAIIDTVKSIKQDEYIEKIKSIIGDKKVDYLVMNHMEPDHSSGIEELLSVYPDMIIVGNKKTFPMLKNFYNIEGNVLEVGEGDTLSLGKHTLQFFMTPMVHWPESMVTYDTTDKILFSMDIFGSYKAPVGSIFDDENDLASFEDPIRRYYATIVGKVAGQAMKALDKLCGIEIGTICPSHGLVWRSNPGHILDRYVKMSRKETVPGVVIAYGSMYGCTQKSAETLAIALKDNGVKEVVLYDVSKTDISFIVSDIWKYKGLLMGAPAYYGKIFPKMANLLYKLTEIKVDNHKVGFFTDFSWSGGAEKNFNAFIEEAKVDVISDMVMVKGRPDENDVLALNELAKKMAEEMAN